MFHSVLKKEKTYQLYNRFLGENVESGRHIGDPGGIRTHGLSLRRRPLYPTELRNHVSKVLIFQGFRGIGDCSPWSLGGVFANRGGQFLISFSNFGGRTFSHLLIFDLPVRGSAMIRMQINSGVGPFSSSRKGGSRPFS